MTEATRELSETMRLRTNVAPHTNAVHPATTGARPTKTPKDVATPFPPVNRNQQDQSWPATTAHPQPRRHCQGTSTPSKWPIHAGSSVGAIVDAANKSVLMLRNRPANQSLQAMWAVYYYTGFGYWTSVMSALTTWGVIAGLP